MLYLIRHPQPIVEPGICYGASDLAPEPAALTRLVEKIRQDIPNNSLFVSSPLSRCALVVKRLIEEGFIGIEQLAFEARLQEMHFGHWEMQAWDSIERRLIDAWAADRLGFQVPGGESVMQLGERCVQALTHWQTQAHAQSRPLALLVHAGVIQMLRAHCTHGDFRAYASTANPKIDYGTITTLLWPK